MGETMVLAGIIVLVALSGCGSKSQTEIEEGLSNFTSLYPTKDLMSFFDKEGFRDDNFEEGDKGVWYVQTKIAKEIDDALYSSGMTLRINRNTGEATGSYTVRETYDDFNKDKEDKYNIRYDKEGYHFEKEIDDVVLKREIEDFKFLVQYIDLQKEYLEKGKVIKKMYNPEVPMYELKYELDKADKNIKSILDYYSNYDIKVDENPTLRIKGSGSLIGSSIGTRSIEIMLEKDKNIFVTSSVIYVPDKEYENEE